VTTNKTGLVDAGSTINGKTLSNFEDKGGGVYWLYYTIAEGDTDISDASVVPGVISLRDPISGLSFTDTTMPVWNRSPGIDAHRPYVTNATIVGRNSTDTANKTDNLVEGDFIRVTLTFNEAIDYNGLENVILQIGSEKWVNLESVTGNTMTFRYDISSWDFAESGEVRFALHKIDGVTDSNADINGNKIHDFIPPETLNLISINTPASTPPADTIKPTLMGGNTFITTTGSFLHLEFSELVLWNTSGTITLKNLDGTGPDVVINLASPLGQIDKTTDWTNQLTITLNAELAYNTQYAVHLSAGAVLDRSHNTINAVTDETRVYETYPVDPHPLINGGTVSLGSDGQLLIIDKAGIDFDGTTSDFFYYWDRDGDGVMSPNDKVDHNTLDALFIYNELLDTINPNAATTGTDTTYRFTSRLNGVKMGLLTAGMDPYGEGYAPSTSVGGESGHWNSGTWGLENPTYDDLLAVWDEYNGTTVGDTNLEGRPSDYIAPPPNSPATFWAADSDGAGRHAYVDLSTGYTGYEADTALHYVMVQILG
jgi:hypothetical protein